MSFWSGILYSYNGVVFDKCSHLIGKKFSGVCGENDRLLVACSDGVFEIGDDHGTAKKICDKSFISIAGGKGFLIGIDQEQRLYSWGHEGEDGQLGQGANHRKVFEPLQIPYNGRFRSISCGEAFSIALDDNGQGHSWGQVRSITPICRKMYIIDHNVHNNVEL